jgi:hypothetical protein
MLTSLQYLWPDSDAPRYAIAMGTSAGFSLATAAGAWVMKFWLMRLNKRIHQTEDETIVKFAY